MLGTYEVAKVAKVSRRAARNVWRIVERRDEIRVRDHSARTLSAYRGYANSLGAEVRRQQERYLAEQAERERRADTWWGRAAQWGNRW